MERREGEEDRPEGGGGDGDRLDTVPAAVAVGDGASASVLARPVAGVGVTRDPVARCRGAGDNRSGEGLAPTAAVGKRAKRAVRESAAAAAAVSRARRSSMCRTGRDENSARKAGRPRIEDARDAQQVLRARGRGVHQAAVQRTVCKRAPLCAPERRWFGCRWLPHRHDLGHS